MRKAEYISENETNFSILYKPVSDPGSVGYLDKELVKFRNGRPPKTTGNPYYVLGEPIGDMRDNMDQPSVDISEGISDLEKEIHDGAGRNRIRFYLLCRGLRAVSPCVSRKIDHRRQSVLGVAVDVNELWLHEFCLDMALDLQG